MGEIVRRAALGARAAEASELPAVCEACFQAAIETKRSVATTHISEPGRRNAWLIDGVERQVSYLRAALRDVGEADVALRGALCFPNVDGLPLFRQ